MTTEIQTNSNLPAIDFSDNTKLAEELRKKYENLPAVEDEKTRKIVTAGIGDFKKLRGAIEKTRKERKAESLEYGRNLDKAAKAATDMVAEIEQELIDLRQPYDDQKAEQENLKIIELQKAEDERIRLIQEKEASQLAEQQRLERERLQMAEERRLFEEEKNRAEFEKKALEDAKIQAEQERLRAEKQKEAQAEIDRKARELAELEREEKAKKEEQARLDKIKQDHANELARIEADRLEEERLKKEQAAKKLAEKEEAERQKLLMPEKEKLSAFADFLDSIDIPEIKDKDLLLILEKATVRIATITSDIRAGLE